MKVGRGGGGHSNLWFACQALQTAHAKEISRGYNNTPNNDSRLPAPMSDTPNVESSQVYNDDCAAYLLLKKKVYSFNFCLLFVASAWTTVLGGNNNLNAFLTFCKW